MDQSAKEIAAPDLGLGGERGVVGVTAVWWEEVESAVGSVPVVVLAVGFARGSAELGQLVAQQAGAEEYASKLPGLARLSGCRACARRRPPRSGISPRSSGGSAPACRA